jgi:hypothetical protein
LVILMTMPVFYTVELLAWLPLRLAHLVRHVLRRPTKRVNRPGLHWTM